MDDFWNISETAPPTLDNFFDEESDVTWTGSTKRDSTSGSLFSVGDKQTTNISSVVQQENSIPERVKSHRYSLSSGSLSSILDNISIHSDSAISGIEGSRTKGVSRALGEKIESWKPPVTIKWKNDAPGSGSCLQCTSKDDEIVQLKRRLEGAFFRLNVTLAPEDTIRNMLLGLPYSLENYKLLEDKIKLLDAALQTVDSSTILAVVIYIKNTLNRSTFLKKLQKRPHATQIYINYLKQRHENAEALDILGLLRKTEEAALLKYNLAFNSKTSELQIKNMKTALQTHFLDSSLTYEAKMVQQHIDLLSLQYPIDEADFKDQTNPMFIQYPRASSLLKQPLLTTLYYCSMYHWEATENQTKSPLFLKKHFNITEKQFLWTVLRARAKVGHFPLPVDLENLMVAQSLFRTLSALGGISGNGRVVKNNLSIDRVIDTLALTGAPSNVLAAFINLLDSDETKLKFGLAYHCHQVVIETYVNLREKEAMQHYMKDMLFGSPEYIKAEHALRTAKWKN